MDRRLLVILGIMGLAVAASLVVWHFQGERMKHDFVRALRKGEVDTFNVDLQQKVWSESELADASVIALPQDAGKERAIERAVHTRGRVVVSSLGYSYQATIRDTSTGVLHVFGYRRQKPGGWL